MKEIYSVKKNNKYVYLFVGSLVTFMLTFILLLHKAGISDYYEHTALANWKSIFKFEISYPGWHIITALCKVFFSDYVSAALSTGLFNTATYLAIIFVMRKVTDVQYPMASILALAMMLCGPLYFPLINRNYYLGQQTVNVWHNPTHIAVKAIALISGYYIWRCMNEESIEKRYYILAGLTCALSVFFKPSWAQIVLPTVFLLYLYKLIIGKMDWNKMIKIFFTLIPTALLVLAESIWIWWSGENEGGTIAFGWFKVWSYYSNIGSEIISFAFPLFVMLLRKNYFANKKNTDCLLLLLVAVGEYGFLYETGRVYVGNFGWGLQLACFFIFLNALCELINWNCELKRGFGTKKEIVSYRFCVTLFIFHVICGIVYWFLLFFMENFF